MKTVRKVAEELDVSRQTIYSKLTDDFKGKFTAVHVVNNKETMVINEEGINFLRRIVNKPDSQIHSQVDSEFDNLINNQLVELLNKNIEILQKQLEVKDNQISELNVRLKEAQELNRNNQVLLHREQEQPKMLESDTKISLFKKLFGKQK